MTVAGPASLGCHRYRVKVLAGTICFSSRSPPQDAVYRRLVPAPLPVKQQPLIVVTEPRFLTRFQSLSEQIARVSAEHADE